MNDKDMCKESCHYSKWKNKGQDVDKEDWKMESRIIRFLWERPLRSQLTCLGPDPWRDENGAPTHLLLPLTCI